MNIGGILGELIGAIIGLYIIQQIPNWHLPFITTAFSLYAPYATVAIILSMIFRMCMYAFPFYRMQKLFETGAHIVSITSLYMLIVIFPFNFSGLGISMINTIIRFAFIIALFGTCVAAITSLVRMILGETHSK